MVELIRWPATVLLIAVIFMLLFRSRIGAWIDRVRRIGRGGIDAAPSPPQESVGRREPSAVERAMREIDSPLLREAEENIRKAIDEKGILDPAERIDVVSRHLAASAIAFTFERIYNHIWGSQIHALRQLNVRGEVGLPLAHIRPIFDYAVRQYPGVHPASSFESWLAFLRGQTLVRDAPTGVALTVRGREFLKYIVDNGYPEQKAF